MSVITRFAPSPTGFLHIGGARTALFNYLFAKHHSGKFLLRVEDTDKKRSTQEAIDVIINGLQWLGLHHDDEIHFQSENIEKHKQVVEKLLSEGKAYRCYCTSQELAEYREEAQKQGEVFKYPGIWRDKDQSEAPQGVEPAIRIKAPKHGDILIDDLIQGQIKYPASEIDDMVIMRSDGTPTYMLAVVADDIAMGVTHIIRGDDHLTNTFRQKVIYDGLGVKLPETAHLPLIHGQDGAKLSKRHGALGVNSYADMGYLPEAMVNYLMRLGWSWGEEEKISLPEAIKRFDIKSIGKSPSRFDQTKLDHINHLCMKEADYQRIVDLIKPELEEEYNIKPTDTETIDKITKLMPHFIERSSTLKDIVEQAEIVLRRKDYTEKAANMLDKGKDHINPIKVKLQQVESWNYDNIKSKFNDYSEEMEVKFGKFMPAVRAAVCGTMEAPGLIEVLEALGKSETLKRLESY